jgi:hypothetical protein
LVKPLVSQKAQPVVADTDPIKGALAVICAALMGIVDKIRAAKIIQNALGIESDDVANYCLPKSWPADRAQRARVIGEWLQTEARYLA